MVLANRSRKKKMSVPFTYMNTRVCLPVIHSDDSIFRFHCTLTKHEQLERVDHGHLFTRHSAGTNLIQRSKITRSYKMEKEKKRKRKERKSEETTGWTVYDPHVY